MYWKLVAGSDGAYRMSSVSSPVQRAICFIVGLQQADMGDGWLALLVIYSLENLLVKVSDETFFALLQFIFPRSDLLHAALRRAFVGKLFPVYGDLGASLYAKYTPPRASRAFQKVECIGVMWRFIAYRLCSCDKYKHLQFSQKKPRSMTCLQRFLVFPPPSCSQWLCTSSGSYRSGGRMIVN